MIGNFNKEAPKSIWIDGCFCLRIKTSVFKCGDDSKNILKGICKPQSKVIKFDDYKKCLDGGDYRKGCDNFLTRSFNQ